MTNRQTDIYTLVLMKSALQKINMAHVTISDSDLTVRELAIHVIADPSLQLPHLTHASHDAVTALRVAPAPQPTHGQVL